MNINPAYLFLGKDLYGKSVEIPLGDRYQHVFVTYDFLNRKSFHLQVCGEEVKATIVRDLESNAEVQKLIMSDAKLAFSYLEDVGVETFNDLKLKGAPFSRLVVLWEFSEIECRSVTDFILENGEKLGISLVMICPPEDLIGRYDLPHVVLGDSHVEVHTNISAFYQLAE